MSFARLSRVSAMSSTIRMRIFSASAITPLLTVAHRGALSARPARSGIYREAVAARDGCGNADHIVAPDKRPESSSASASSVHSPSATPYGLHGFLPPPLDAGAGL